MPKDVKPEGDEKIIQRYKKIEPDAKFLNRWALSVRRSEIQRMRKNSVCFEDRGIKTIKFKIRAVLYQIDTGGSVFS